MLFRSYTFCIKAANNDGKSNEEPAILHIHILPVWYSTWWALSLFALSFALLVFVIIFYFAMPSGTNFFYMAAAIIITFVINRIADAFFFSLAPSMRLDIK